jgi:hypothetical protein
MASERDAAELRMDRASLFREETFTDRRLGAIRVPPGLGGSGGPRGSGNIRLP